MPLRFRASDDVRHAPVLAADRLSDDDRTPVEGPGGDSAFPPDVSDEELALALRLVSWNERDLRHFFLRRRGFPGRR